MRWPSELMYVECLDSCMVHPDYKCAAVIIIVVILLLLLLPPPKVRLKNKKHSLDAHRPI